MLRSDRPGMEPPDPQAPDSQTLALRALGWVLSDEDRAQRFLTLTGLTPDDLRAALGEASLLTALLDFLMGHEPDLIACAEALEVAPPVLVAARAALSDGEPFES